MDSFRNPHFKTNLELTISTYRCKLYFQLAETEGGVTTIVNFFDRLASDHVFTTRYLHPTLIVIPSKCFRSKNFSSGGKRVDKIAEVNEVIGRIVVQNEVILTNISCRYLMVRGSIPR